MIIRHAVPVFANVVKQVLTKEPIFDIWFF
jgi:hypothetical protein